MPMHFQQVVVAVDGSEEAERALGVAAGMAAQAGLPLLLVAQIAAERQRSTAEATLRQAADGVRRGSVDRHVVVAEGTSAGLVEVLEERPHSLMCMSTHARSAAGQLLLGSVAVEVLRHSPAPVVLVGPNAGQPPDEVRYEQVIACVDESPAAERVLPVVRAIADQWGLVSLVAEVRAVGADGATPTRLVSMAERLDGLGRVDWDVLWSDDPVEALDRYVEGRKGSLLALATEAPRIGTRLREGSTTVELARRAHCPLVAVGPACRTADLEVGT